MRCFLCDAPIIEPSIGEWLMALFRTPQQIQTKKLICGCKFHKDCIDELNAEQCPRCDYPLNEVTDADARRMVIEGQREPDAHVRDDQSTRSSTPTFFIF